LEGSSEASDFISFIFDLEHFPSSEHWPDYIRSPVRGTCSIYITMALEVGTHAAIPIMVPSKTTMTITRIAMAVHLSRRKQREQVKRVAC